VAVDDVETLARGAARGDGHDIAVDFMDMTDDGRLWTRLSDVRRGFVPVAGQYAVVGCEDAPASAWPGAWTVPHLGPVRVDGRGGRRCR
jgi:hypothetical protein